MIEIAKKILRIDEGFREKPYYCHLKFPTIGYGFRIPNTKQHDPLPPITMTRAAAEDLLDKKVRENEKILASNDFKEIWPALNDVRKAVLVSIAFQVGMYGLLKFRQMRVGLSNLDYQKASDEIIDSAAYRDPKTRDRFTRNAQMMLTGKLLDYYK
jgi:lysozyme